jgi:hypothetical protein
VISGGSGIILLWLNLRSGPPDLEFHGVVPGYPRSDKTINQTTPSFGKGSLPVNALPPRRFTRLAIAIIVGAVLVSVTLIAGDSIQRTETIMSDLTPTATETDTVTVTDTTTTTQTATEATTVTISPDSAVVYSPISDDLQLTAAIEPTSFPFGQNVTVIATVLDVGPSAFQLNATGLANPVYGPCTQDVATGVYVYSGYYASGNISKATQLQLYDPDAVYLCPTMSTVDYTFEPPRGLTEVSVLTGDWSGSRFQSFPVGEYTVSVFDAWGQVAIGHFDVSPSGPLSTSSCSGYPPEGDCLALYSYNFTVSVDYGGAWAVSYEGYNLGGAGGNPTANGNYNGTGPDSRSVVLTCYGDQGLTLCATADKLDGSNATLTLLVTGSNSTSAPYGSMTYCGTVVP